MEAKDKAENLIYRLKEKILEGQVFTDDFNPEREKRHTEQAKRVARFVIEFAELNINKDELREIYHEINRM
jgi:DNA-binding transcriptional regulator YhcF (GntR family)